MKSGKLILLIDDDPIANYLNLKLLNSINAAEVIKVYQNGEEALDFLMVLNKENNQVPDLILLDLNMPLMNGFEFLKAFKSLNISCKDKIKIIIMSLSLNDSLIRKVALAGYFSIEKPLSKENVLDLFNKYSYN